MSNMSEPRVYNRLAALRVERNLEREELAEQLEITPQTLGYIEQGTIIPELELALHVGEVLKVPVEAIFSRQPFHPVGEETRERLL
jgi:putative transcriptional regulator